MCVCVLEGEAVGRVGRCAGRGAANLDNSVVKEEKLCHDLMLITVSKKIILDHTRKIRYFLGLTKAQFHVTVKLRLTSLS